MAADVQVDREAGASDVPTGVKVDPAVLDAERQAADLGKIRYLDVDRVREIAYLDMMGEYGSKVGKRAASTDRRSISSSSISSGIKTKNRVVSSLTVFIDASSARHLLKLVRFAQ